MPKFGTGRAAAVFLTAAMLLLIAGCGQKPAGQETKTSDNKDKPAQTSGAKTRISVGGGTIGGTYYVVASGIAKLINQYIPNTEAVAEATAAGLENTRLLQSGKIAFGLSDPLVIYDAIKGRGAFKDEKPYDNLMEVMTGFSSPAHVVVRADSGINTLADLKGKTVTTAPGIQKTMLGQTLEPYGLDLDKDVKVVAAPFDQGASDLKDGRVQALAAFVGAPNSSVLSSFSSGKQMKLLNIDDTGAKKIGAKYPYWVKATIKANTYPGQTTDINTVQIQIKLLTNKNVPEDLVYQVVKVLNEHNDELAQIHPEGKHFSLPNAVSGPVLPHHPGAIKYYKEKGALK